MAKKGVTKSVDLKQKEAEEGLKIKQFLNDTQEELRKVVWPSRQQLISESAAVMSMVILVATLIYFIDKLFYWGAGKVFG
ncbi:MAG: preprotein translocase subunit SecE [Okeania sp. SIO2D1]|nr:preprotein translocase subunit SecE [Okeania sp. SIO2D1]